MRLKEFFVVLTIIVIGYLSAYLVSLCFSFAKYCILIMNMTLMIFYCMFLTQNLPRSYYKDDKFDTCTKYSIILVIFFLFTCSLWSFIGDYRKIIGRIGFLPLFLYMWAVMFYAFIKKITDASFVDYKRYFGISLRCVMILFSNLLIVSMLTYSYSSSYENGKLSKIIHDGGDVYETTYNDSLSMYQTKVHIVDKKDKTDYMIYYDDYPDRILRIDTLFSEEIR